MLCEKSGQLVKPICRRRKLPIRVPEKPLIFIRTHNETLSVTAMCVSNPDRSQFCHQNVTRISLNLSATRLHEKNFCASGVYRSTKKVGLCFAC